MKSLARENEFTRGWKTLGLNHAELAIRNGLLRQHVAIVRLLD
jgi:hypothetical protein